MKQNKPEKIIDNASNGNIGEFVGVRADLGRFSKRLIGITGNIGSGKSLVSNYLSERGFKVIDFDEISRSIYIHGKPAYYDIVNLFGKSVLDDFDEIDRKKLGEIVFSDKDKLEKLNEITHDAIYSEARTIIECSDEELLFLDIPLLYETEELQQKYGIIFEEIWLVYCDRNTQIERVMKRDDISYEESVRRIDSQMSMEEKLKFANKVIFNDRDVDYAYRQVESLLAKL